MSRHVGLSFVPVIPGLLPPRPEQIALPVQLPEQPRPDADRVAQYRDWQRLTRGSTALSTEALLAGLGQRWATALRRRGPQRNASKAIARALREAGCPVEPRTVQGWLLGQTPYLAQFLGAVRVFGPELAIEVLALPAHQETAAVAAELRRLAERAVTLAQELAR